MRADCSCQNCVVWPLGWVGKNENWSMVIADGGTSDQHVDPAYSATPGQLISHFFIQNLWSRFAQNLFMFVYLSAIFHIIIWGPGLRMIIMTPQGKANKDWSSNLDPDEKSRIIVWSSSHRSSSSPPATPSCWRPFRPCARAFIHILEKYLHQENKLGLGCAKLSLA